jgi:mRNA degradation ribonuclease J1/J2
MKLFNSCLALNLSVEEAVRKFVITGAEYNEIMRVARKDGRIDARKKKLLSKLKKAIDNNTLKKNPGMIPLLCGTIPGREKESRS